LNNAPNDGVRQAVGAAIRADSKLTTLNFITTAFSHNRSALRCSFPPSASQKTSRQFHADFQFQ
jgi:hypothetical protein